MQTMADTVDITNVTALHPKAERRTRSKPDRTNSERQKRFRDKRKTQLPVTHESTVTPSPTDKAPDRHNAVTVTASLERNGVAVAHPTGGATDVMAYVAAIGLATVGVGLSVVGMVETATYA